MTTFAKPLEKRLLLVHKARWEIDRFEKTREKLRIRK